MYGFFKDLKKKCVPDSTAVYSSSTGHRNTQRLNAMAEVTANSLQNLSPAVLIPPKLAQLLLAMYALSRTDTYINERLIHALQGIIAGAQLVLACMQLFKREDCQNSTATDDCTAVLFTHYLYFGIILFTWAIAEASKAPYSDPTLLEKTTPTPTAASEDEKEDGDEASPEEDIETSSNKI